jgi:hypothetical protein
MCYCYSYGVFFYSIIVLLIYPPIGGSDASKNQDKKQITNISFTEPAAKVIGIYPKDAFGPDQKKSLHTILENSDIGLEVIDLDILPLKDMQDRNISKLLDTISYLLKHNNIAAIVGPSISECSKDVIKLLYDNDSKVPIFVTAAVSSAYLKWDEYATRVNIFRTGSGIDKRADLIAKFLQDRNITTHSLFIVEDNSPKPTFGKMYFDALMSKSDALRQAQVSKHIDIYGIRLRMP